MFAAINRLFSTAYAYFYFWAYERAQTCFVAKKQPSEC